MRALRFLLIVSLVAVGAFMYRAAPADAGSDAPQATPSKTVNLSFLDTSADPCTDFYQYACGGWIKNNPIPPDRSRWGTFSSLSDRNLEIMHQILEKAAADPGASPINKKIGDYYASCMDEDAINKKGISPIKPELDRIAKLKDKKALAAEVAHLNDLGVRPFFRLSAEQDFKDANTIIAGIDQGGYSLGDRDYYTKDDAKSQKLRAAYKDHVQKVFALAGDDATKAASEADAVMKIETALASAALTRVARREPTAIYHKMSKKEFAALAPGFNWDSYFNDMKTPKFDSVNVAVPDFVKGLQAELDAASLDDIKSYLRWQLIHSAAGLLSSDFVDEDFNFYGKTMAGTKQLLPRWKRCVGYEDRDLGELTGQPWVAEAFPPDAKQRTVDMVREIETSMQLDINKIDWMSDTTKQQAQVKLKAVANKIGYPDKWRDYSKLEIVRGDALGNLMRSSDFEYHRRLSKIGTRTDRTEWGMTPPTVNAYYSPTQNNINFPAGILQPPFYSNDRDDAVNYGGVGAVVGHELTHGFDDEGRKFDPEGNLRDWWTDQDGKAFEERAQCLIDEYNSFPVEDIHVNGKLTLGENTADNGGVRLAHMALERKLNGALDQKNGDYTEDQLFFLGYGQIWCESARPEAARNLALTNEHSPGKYRVDGVVRNMPEFRQAWGCKVGQPMAPENACRVW